MSINLIDLMKDQLGGAVLGQVGKHLGIDDKSAGAGLGAILPTVLGGLMKQASTPSGADALNNTLDNDVDDGLLDKLPGLLSGGGDSGMLSSLGTTLLSGIFGDKVGSIVGILAKVTGINSDKSGSLLALLAPVVMSLLGKQKKSMGLDASGLSSLLMSQKDAVADSMPAGMSSALGLGDLGIQERQEATPAPVPSHSHESSGGGMKWLLPLVILGGLGLLAYNMLGNPAAPDLKKGIDLGVDAGDVVPDISVPEVSLPDAGGLTSQLTGVFDNYRDTLSGISDEASATEAVPKLTEINSSLDGLSSTFDKLPEVARGPIAGKVTSMLEPLQGIIEKLYAIPGVKPILEPLISSMLEKAKALVPSA